MSRSCPGQHVARMEMRIMLAVLGQRFNFSLVNPEKSLQTEYHIVSQPIGSQLFVRLDVNNGTDRMIKY